MNKLITAPALLVPFLLSAAAPAQAQFGPSKIAQAGAAVKPASIARGGHGVLVVTLAIGPRYHVNANKPNDPAYIATVFSGQPTPGVVYGPARYPVAKSVAVSYSPKPLLVYTGRAVILVPFTVAKTAAPSVKILRGTVSFQGCDAKSCYPPTSASVSARVSVK